MPGTTLTFPFVDLQQRLQPERLNRLARNGHPARPARRRDTIIEDVAGWLIRAQDKVAGKGVAGSYHLQTGWSTISPEATSSAIPTLLQLAARFSKPSFRERAVQLGLSLAENYSKDGNFAIPYDAFNSICAALPAISGWVDVYRHTRDIRFKTAACEAGRLLISLPRESPSAVEPLPGYEAQAARALACLNQTWPNTQYQQAAQRFGNAAVDSCSSDGYPFENNNQHGAEPALAKVTAVLYAVLEAGIFSGNQSWIDAAELGARRLHELYRARGTMAGRYGPQWRGDFSFHCMSGCAQTALLWLRLYQLGYPHDYFMAAARVNDFVASTVDINHPDPGIKGGIRAGYPLWVDYYPMTYQAMAAKYALDAWLLEDTLTIKREPKRKLTIKRNNSRENI